MTSALIALTILAIPYLAVGFFMAFDADDEIPTRAITWRHVLVTMLLGPAALVAAAAMSWLQQKI